MTGRREQLRDSELLNPRTSARSLNDLLLGIYKRLEAVERRLFVDMHVTSGSILALDPIVIAAPKWTVRAVYIAKMYDVTAGAPVALPFLPAWESTGAGITITGIVPPNLNSRYDLTFEVRG